MCRDDLDLRVWRGNGDLNFMSKHWAERVVIRGIVEPHLIRAKGRLRVFAGGTADTREEREGVRGRHVIRYVSHFEACTAGRNDKEKLLLKMGPKKLRYKFYQISWQFPKKVKNNRN